MTTPAEHNRRKAICLSCTHIEELGGRQTCGKRSSKLVPNPIKLKWDREGATCPAGKW